MIVETIRGNKDVSTFALRCKKRLRRPVGRVNATTPRPRRDFAVLLRARISLTARLVKTQRTKWKLNGYNSVLMMMREAAFYAEQTEIIADCIT
jgi:hypothetical protein|tara:strand:- start:4046 stop:4327 length:282 start_codon:yes stop_codon:yes gene_type:complete